MSKLVGTIDGFEAPFLIHGWAVMSPSPYAWPLNITVMLGGNVVGRTDADIARPDLLAHGVGPAGFTATLSLPATLEDFATGRLRVEVSHAGQDVGTIVPHSALARNIAENQIQQTCSALTGSLGVLTEVDLDAVLEASLPGLPAAVRQPMRQLIESLRSEAGKPAVAEVAFPDEATEAEFAASVLRRFESLGANCEFGLVQRHFGVEGISLLRWGASWDGLDGLKKALKARLAGAGTIVSCYTSGSEYISVDETFRLVFHTSRFIERDDLELLLRNERIRIPFLARNLIENIEDASSIFVYQDGDRIDFKAIDDLTTILREIGPASVLWVTIAPDAGMVGQVEQVRPYIYKGYVDRFSPIDNVFQDCSFDVWLAVCSEVLRLEAQSNVQNADIPIEHQKSVVSRVYE